MIRILFTGGGTGGHIYPILAITEEFQVSGDRIEISLRYFGAPGPYQNLLEKNGIKVSKILSAKLRRYFDLRNLIEIPFFLPLSIIQALWKVFWFMPDVLFSKGGPASLPVVLACHFYRIPVIIHDSDSAVGLANRMALRFADKIALSFEAAISYLMEKYPNKKEKLASKIILTGNPVRRSLIAGEAFEVEAARRILGLDSEKPVILIIGGSQGAVKINNFMMEIAEELVKDFQILHQTGVKNFNEIKKEMDIILKNHPEEEKKRYQVFPYFEDNLKNAYLASDMVICRASGGAIFENAAFGKPSILIPLSSSVVGGHQVSNAYEYARSGAGIVIEEPNLEPNLFLSQLKKLFSEPEKLKRMSEAARKFAKPGAARALAQEILNLGSRG